MADIEDPTKKDKGPQKTDGREEKGESLDLSSLRGSTRLPQQPQARGGLSAEDIEELLDKAEVQKLSPDEKSRLIDHANQLIVRPGQDLGGDNDYALGRIVDVLGNSSDDDSKQALTRLFAFSITNPAYSDSAIRALSYLCKSSPERAEELASTILERGLDPLAERALNILSRTLPDQGAAFFSAHGSNKHVSRFVNETLPRVA